VVRALLTACAMTNPDSGARTRDAAADERRARRHAMAAPVELTDGTGRTLNVSNSGILFETDRALEPGSAVTLSIVLSDVYPMPPVRVRAEGRVVRVERRDRGHGVAVAFTSWRVETADHAAASPAPATER